jgi:hypothetical protein
MLRGLTSSGSRRPVSGDRGEHVVGGDRGAALVGHAGVPADFAELCHARSGDEKSRRYNRVVDEVASCLRADE